MNRLNRRDLANTVVLGLLYFVCVAIGVFWGNFFDNRGNMFYAPAFAALVGATVYFLLLAKVPKFGAISLWGLFIGGFFFLSGHMVGAFLPGLIFGLVADVLAHLGRYQQRLTNSLSFCLFSLVNSGPILLMWLAPLAYKQSLESRGKSQAYIERVMLSFDWGTMLWFFLTILLGALVGSLIGHYFAKRLANKI